MKQIASIATLVLLGSLLLQISCKKEYSCENCLSNKPPIANAGNDTSITLPSDSISLDGSLSSHPDDGIASYEWVKISGPDTFHIVNNSAESTTANKLVKAVYNFELIVTDKGGLSGKDTMQVTVYPAGNTNRLPVANAGHDTSIILPVSVARLDGSGSFDPDNNITNYQWAQISGPAPSNIANANAVQTPVTNLVQGTYQFELNVTDAGALFSKDTMEVIVNTFSQVDCGALSQTYIGNLSIPRGSASMLTAGNKILFSGGFVGAVGPPLYGASPRVDIYDMSTQTWSTADLSVTRFHIGTITSGNKIYFAGGYNGAPCTRVDVYDALTNTWSTAELSEARSSVIAVAAGNKVLFAGGNNHSGGSNKVDIYDQSAGTWSATTLSQPVGGSYRGNYEIGRSGVISVGNKIYFVTSNHTIDVYDAGANIWSVLVCSPGQLWGASVVSIGSKIYFSGKAPVPAMGGNANTLEIYNTSNNSWSSTSMLQARSDMNGIAAVNKIFWAGGSDSSYLLNGEENVRCVNNIEMYDVITGSHSYHNLPFGACWIRTLKTGNKIFFATTNNYTEIYDLNSQLWSTCNGYFFQSLGIGNSIYQLGEDSQVWKLEF